MSSRSKRRLLAILISALVGTTASVVTAQGVPMNVADHDTDGDGRLNATEFYTARGERVAERIEAGGRMRNLATAPSFEQLDGDGDGYLTGRELAIGHAERMRQRTGGGPGGGRGPATPASFETYDRDGNGVVTMREFRQTRRERQALNRGMGQPMRKNPSPPGFASFDLNRDGVLTADEFTPGSRRW